MKLSEGASAAAALRRWERERSISPTTVKLKSIEFHPQKEPSEAGRMNNGKLCQSNLNGFILRGLGCFVVLFIGTALGLGKSTGKALVLFNLKLAESHNNTS